MRRIVIVFMLLVAMLAGMMSAQAAEAEVTVQVRASKTEVQVGDTVEYTVLATGSGVVAMQFEVRLPEGLRYVPNSGKTPENLALKLGVPAADWTEGSMMFTFYNDIGITFAEGGTELISFSCVAEKEGAWDVELYELLPFDGDFMEFTPTLRVQTVNVTRSAGETKPVEPDVPGETVPAVTDPDHQVIVPIAPDHNDEPMSNSPDAGQAPDQVTDSTVTDSVDQIVDGSESGTEPTIEQEGTVPVQNEVPEVQEKGRTWLWTALAGGLMILAVAVVVILSKKKSA